MTVPNTNISFSGLWNIIKPTAHDGSAIRLGTDFARHIWASGATTVPPAGEATSITTHFRGGVMPQSITGETTSTFSTITLNDKYNAHNNETNREHSLVGKGPYYFEDEGTADSTTREHNYPRNTYRQVTFNSEKGIRVWVSPPPGGDTESNYFAFELSNYSQYDRLGIQVSDAEGDNKRAIFTNITGVPWLQTSERTTISDIEPWSSDFGGSRFDSRESANGYIFPATVKRAYGLGLKEGYSLDIPNKKAKFIFYSDSSSESYGWKFSIYTL